MVPHPQGKFWKEEIQTCESEKAPDELEETTSQNPASEEKWSSEGQAQECLEMSGSEGCSGSEKNSMVELEAEEGHSCDREEDEQAFLVGLYRFMKERKTPIERLPHLGFKQINLWRLHQAAEKLGGYQLVTGRRLWKNVYDELGGSPGSTSAATCTRRHYERLVLPYVRHLRGEDDKPLPFSKPRKQYKVSKECSSEKREEELEKSMKTKLRNHSEEFLIEKGKQESLLSVTITTEEAHEQTGSENQSDSHWSPEEKVSNRACCSLGLPKANEHLFSSLYYKGNHGILSPLAKKKLLAQASKAEALHGDGEHSSTCSRVKKARIDNDKPSSSATEKEANCIPVIQPNQDATSSDPVRSPQETVPSPLSHSMGGTCSERQLPISDHRTHGVEVALHRNKSNSTVFSGSFRVYKSEDFTPIGCHSMRDNQEGFTTFQGFSNSAKFPLHQKYLWANPLENRQEKEDPPAANQPVNSWSLNGDVSTASHEERSFQNKHPFFRGQKACWVPPTTNSAKPHNQQMPPAPLSKNRDTGQHTMPSGCHSPEPPTKQGHNEISPVHGKLFKAVSPFLKEVHREHQDSGFPKRAPQAICKPRPVMPCLNCTSALTVTPPMLKGGMLQRFGTSFRHPMDPMKNPPSSPPVSRPLNPYLFPAIPGPLLSVSTPRPDHCHPLSSGLTPYTMGYSSSMHHRLYPLPSWQVPSGYTTTHMPSFHLNTKL